MKNETGNCYACIFLLMVTPCWPAFVMFCREQAWSDSTCGVPRKVRGVLRWQLQNMNAGTKRRRRKKMGGVQLSPTHAPSLRTLKKTNENICTNDETNSTGLELKG